jgi:uncharacterized protein with HEPN domain
MPPERSSDRTFTDYRNIKSFRNVIVHGYDAIDDATTWGVIETKLPILREELATLMAAP